MASPTGTTPSARRSRARCCASSRRRASSRRARRKGARLRRLLEARLADHPNVGEIRGRGLLSGHRARGRPRDPRALPAGRPTDRGGLAAARARGVLVYSGTGNADGIDGDQILLGPPFVVTDAELETIVDALSGALEAAVATIGAMTAM